MTAALTLYSATFMRYSMAVTPKNYLLLACHSVNFLAQGTQGARYLKYWKYVELFPHLAYWLEERSAFGHDFRLQREHEHGESENGGAPKSE